MVEPRLRGAARRAIGFFREVFKEFGADRCSTQAAAISYYTAFALPPLLVFIFLLVGVFVDPQAVQRVLYGQMRGFLGDQGVAQVQAMVRSADRLHGGGGSTLALVLGIAALTFSASGAFLSLQDALNTAWKVRPDPAQGGLKTFLLKRLLSLGLVLVAAFLLLLSLVASGLLAAFGGFLATLLGGGLAVFLLGAANQAISLGVITLLFAAMFRILPDAVVDWGDIWAGAAFTAVLFVIGKALIGFYIGRSNPVSVFGAAGSFALILLWIYYSSLILLLGAEFTRVLERRRGKPARPAPGTRPVPETPNTQFTAK